MKSPKIFYFKKFRKKSGKLLPITFNKNFQLKLKEFFLFMEKKNIKGVIMLIKNVPRYFAQLKEKLK